MRIYVLPGLVGLKWNEVFDAHQYWKKKKKKKKKIKLVSYVT